MKVHPTTILQRFRLAKRLCAERGYNIFTPSPVHYRAKYQFIGASIDKKAKGVFRIWVRKDSLWIEFYPFFENRPLKQYLEKELGTKILQRRHKSAMKRFKPTRKMVIASEFDEFDLLVPTIHLP